MKKLIKMLFCVLTIAIIIVPSALSVSAKEELRVVDNADLFTPSEEASLEKQINELREKYNQDFAIVTTKGTDGKSIQTYSDLLYKSKKFGDGNDKAGSVFVIDDSSRSFHISTHGKTIKLFKDKYRNQTISTITTKMKAKNYYGAAQAYLNDVSKAIDKGKKKLTLPEAAIALLISLAVGGIFIAAVRHKYSFAGPQCAYPLKENSKLNLSKDEDIFVNETVTSVKLQSSNGGGGGGSSTHTTGGDTFGGGGGKY